MFHETLTNAWDLRWQDARGPLRYEVATPYGELTASGAFSLDKPMLEFDGDGDRLRVSISGAARFDVALDGSPAGGVFESVRATADVPVRVEKRDDQDRTVVDLSGFTLTPDQLRLTWYDGPGDARAEKAVLSEPALARLTEELRLHLAPFLTFDLPTDRIWAAESAAILSALAHGVIVLLPQIQIRGARVLDGWLAVGVDLTRLDAYPGSAGSAAEIGPPPPAPAGREADELRLVMDSPSLATILTVDANLSIKLVAGMHPNVHPRKDAKASIHDDLIEVAVGGTADVPDPFAGQAPFAATLQLKASIGAGGTVYGSVSQHVDVDLPWYADIVRTIGHWLDLEAFPKLRRLNTGTVATLFTAAAQTAVPGFPGLTAWIQARSIAATPDHVMLTGGAGTKPSFSLHAPTDVRPDFEFYPRVIHIRERWLRLWFPSEPSLLNSDPTYRLRCVIRRPGDPLPFFVHEQWSGVEKLEAGPDLWDEPAYLATELEAQISVERPPGREVARSARTVRIEDLFDRSHPYARWLRVHKWWGAVPDEPHVAKRWQSRVRRSAIHKTAIGERCAFCDAGSRAAAQYTVQALDTLPAEPDPDFLDRLCPYCFGSP